MKTVRVTATRNLDMMNAGEVAEVDRDEQVERLLASGHLVEVGEDDKPLRLEEVGEPEVKADEPKGRASRR